MSSLASRLKSYGVPKVISHKQQKKKEKEGCNTRTSREVTHPSTTLAQARLPAEF
ncbi:expressed protein [Arabidopsis lyrata subsp. lyrata]|uniref:Expressed protein n=1 Tax=Arabidopsis lyrata subsp. lyrata TaxID=81972 RepID=D7MYD3_ARALL|nr:expressed protein [Arabidopsis lyrata subsp. lyrata]